MEVNSTGALGAGALQFLKQLKPISKLPVESFVATQPENNRQTAMQVAASADRGRKVDIQA